MSRRNKRKATVERAAPSYSGPMGIQGDYAKYGGGTSVTIPAHILSQMLQNVAPQKNQAQDFAPGSPLTPYQGVVPLGGPRQWSYNVDSNLNTNDRTLGNPEVPTFAQLRNLAMLYSGIGLCERVLLDMIPKLIPNVTLKKVFAEAGAQEKDYQPRIAKWRTFLEYPSPAQNLDIHSWLRMAWIEQTQIDALALFKHKTRGGGLYGLEIIDGASIKPVIDERGMVPDAKAGFPAYQQYPYGVPGDLYTTDQMIYYRESPRAFTPYGLSRVERIIMEVNQALRKKRKDLLRFTEGNVPQGIMEVPPDLNWTPDQIDAYEQMWNALISGNASMQVRVKFTQPGMKYTRLDPEDIMTPFDEFLLNISAAAYGLSMQDLAFTGDIHKSSGDSQQNVMFRRTLAPFILVYSRLLTQLFAEAFHDDMLEVTFGGFEEPEDLQSQASAYSMLVQNAIISPAGVARIMKLPEVPETGPFILPKGGQPVFLENLADPAYRKAQQDAQMAGLQLATQGPQQQTGQGEDEESGEEEADTDQGKKNTSKQGKQTKSDEESPAVQRLITQVEELIARLPLPDDRREERNQREQSAQRTAEVRLFPFPIMGRGESDTSTGQTNAGAPGSDHAEKERSAELRRWRKRAIDDAKAGKAQRGFTTTLIPEAVHARISVELAECHTVEDVHAVFERVRERDTPPFAAASIPAGSQSGGSQEPNKSDWRPKW